jgi:transposase
MASSAKDLQLRELKDAVSQLKTMVSEQTELIKSLRLIIDEKSSHEKVLQEQVDYLTKKLFGSSSERRPDDIPGQQNLFNEAEAEQDPSLLEEETVIVKSQVPQALAGKGPAAASTVAWTMYQKYANGLPLYRQEKDWKQYGAQISRTTLANWIVYCSRNYFQPMYDYFHRGTAEAQLCNGR